MEIYLLRHGIAEEGRAAPKDSARALTAEGRKRLREVLRVARVGGVAPAVILTSPYRRARETAEIAAEELGHKEKLIETSALEPGSTPEIAWDAIRDRLDAPSVMVVGHEPLFSYLTAYLLDAPALSVDVKKGSIIRIDVEQTAARPRGELKWMLTPKLASGRG